MLDLHLVGRAGRSSCRARLGLSGPPSTCDGGANGLLGALKIGRIFKTPVCRIAKLVKMGNDSAIAEFIDDFLMSAV